MHVLACLRGVVGLCTRSASAFASDADEPHVAGVLLGFRCFGTMPPIQPKKAEAPIPHSIHAIGFALLLAVSKLPFGTTSVNELLAPWASILLGFRCFGTMPPIQPKNAEAPIPHSIHAIGFALLLAVSKLPFGTTSAERIHGPLGLNPAGVPLFRNHASNPTKECRSSHPTLYPRHRFCFAFSGFEAAVRHHVRERIRGPFGLNPAGVPLFRNHASNPTKECRSSSHTLSTP